MDFCNQTRRFIDRLDKLHVCYLLLWCSGAGEVLADNISLLRSTTLRVCTNASGECYEVTVLVSVSRECVPSVFGLVITLMATILCPRCYECCSSYL